MCACKSIKNACCCKIPIASLARMVAFVTFCRRHPAARFHVLIVQLAPALKNAPGRAVGDAFFVASKRASFVHIGECSGVTVGLALSAWRGGAAMYGDDEWRERIACLGAVLAYRGREIWPLVGYMCAFGFDDVVRRMYMRAMAWEAYERGAVWRGPPVGFGALPAHDFVVRGAVMCPLRKARLCAVVEDGLAHALRYAAPTVVPRGDKMKKTITVVRTSTGEVFKIAFVGSVHVVLVAEAVCEGGRAHRRLDAEAAIVVHPHMVAADMELELTVADPLNGSSLLDLRGSVLAIWRRKVGERVECRVCYEVKKGEATGCCGHGLCVGCRGEWAKQENGRTCPFCRRALVG